MCSPSLQEGARGRSCPFPLHEGGNAGRATTRVAPTGTTWDDDRDADHSPSFRSFPSQFTTRRFLAPLGMTLGARDDVGHDPPP